MLEHGARQAAKAETLGAEGNARVRDSRMASEQKMKSGLTTRVADPRAARSPVLCSSKKAWSSSCQSPLTYSPSRGS
jgi:hypothetical protein